MKTERDTSGRYIKGHAPNVTSFTSESLLGNKYAKGNAPNRTSFTGKLYGKEHPCWKGGIQYNKSDVAYISTGKNTRVRRPRAVYEETYGTIPDGYVIRHKDANKDNDDITNLEAISRAESLRQNIK